MTPIADLVGPLAEGVILLGVVPAVVLVTGMIAISRVVEWRTEKALTATASDSERQLPGSGA